MYYSFKQSLGEEKRIFCHSNNQPYCQYHHSLYTHLHPSLQNGLLYYSVTHLKIDALATVQTHLRNITTNSDGHASGSRHFQYQIQDMSVTEGSGGESHVQMPTRGGPTRHCLRKLLFGFLCEGLFGLPTSKLEAQCALF